MHGTMQTGLWLELIGLALGLGAKESPVEPILIDISTTADIA